MPQLILLKPILTEKTMFLAQKGQFTFLVAQAATKGAVAQAVESQFKVQVVKMTIGSVQGKTKRTGKRRLVKTTVNGKKAMVTLKAGQMIEYFKLPEKKTKGKKK